MQYVDFLLVYSLYDTECDKYLFIVCLKPDG